MKRVFALILAVCMVFSMGAAAQAEGVSGEFTGTAQGMGGDVTVTLTLADGKITGCTATGDQETVGIGSVVIDSFPAAVVESGSIAVDAVSGATITSNAFVDAAAAALTGHNGEHRNLQGIDQRPVDPRRAVLVDAGRAAGQDHAPQRCILPCGNIRGVGQNFAVHAHLAHAPGYQLVVLAAEIENDDLLAVHAATASC